MEFRELKHFTETIQKIATDDELLALQLELAENPAKGRIIQKTNGARKIRMKVKGKGKSAGSRVIYYWQDQFKVIWMLQAYLKSDKLDLTEIEKKNLGKIIADIKRGLL